MTDPRIHLRDERVLLASIDGLAIIVLRTTTYELREQIDALLDAVAEESPEAIYCVMVRRGEIPRQSPGPTRTWAREVLGRHKERIQGVAYVYLGSWFGRAMATSIMTGFSAVLNVPVKLHRSEEDAVDWLAGLPGAPESFRTERTKILSTLAYG